MTRSPNTIPWQDSRRQRCRAMGVDLSTANETVQETLAHPGPLVGVVSSRVGHHVHRHRQMSQQIAVSMQRIRCDRETLLIAESTAIDPWVTHAAEVFDVPTIRLPSSPDRDPYLIAIPDRVDAVYVRRGGKVTSLLRQRARLQSGIVRVAIDGSAGEQEVVWDLLGAGVVGCYLPSELNWKGPSEQAVVQNRMDERDIDWSSYLVHCTRGSGGPWPDQSWEQYRDDLLLSDAQSAARDCIDSLCRIVQKRRLIADAIVSCRDQPVVCFSAVPLSDLLARRAYRSHLHRWDYEPFGIGVRRDAAERLGMQKVVYGDAQTQRDLPADQKFRFQASGSTHDWSTEREWRSPSDVDLSALDPSQILIFVPDEIAATRVGSWNRGRWPIVVLAQCLS